jgi:general secretion pathway protein D
MRNKTFIRYFRVVRQFVQYGLLGGLLTICAVAAASAPTGNPPPATMVRAIQWQEEKGLPLALIELDGHAPFHHFTLPTPPRLVIDFRNVRQTIGSINRQDEHIVVPPSRAALHGIERVRIGQKGDDVRIVFDLTGRWRSQLSWSGNTLVIRFATPPQAATPPTGKKSFQEGLKHEAAQNWDLAAQAFAQAVAAEPNNVEYQLHWLRTRQQASLSAAQRGDELAARAEFAAAYTAYQQAVHWDATNELARTKMQRMTEQLQVSASPKSSASQPAFYPATGNVIATPADIKPAPSSRSRDLVHNIQFHSANLRHVIEVMAEYLELNVLFDESFRNDTGFRLKLNNVTMARALDLTLLQSHHLFEQVDRRTILIYSDNPANRQRYEQMMVKTFYLGNADLEQARTMLQTVAGAQHQVIPVKQLNALIVRDTMSNLRMYQELLDSIDKHRAEVVVDVNIYEVSRSTSLEIGNQIAASSMPVTQTRIDANGNPVSVTTGNSASLGNLGGIGRAGIAAIAGTAVSPVLGGVGTLLGLPPSSLSLLQTKGQSRLLANTQVHALDGEQNQTKVGRSVPVRLGTSYLPGYATPVPTTGANAAATAITGLLGGGFNSGFDSIQYRDVGLVIDVTPTISKEGYVQIKMKLESTSVESSGLDLNLTPSFTQRSLVTVARVMTGKTAVVAGIKQEAKGDSRTGLPVVGMLPLLGRFFTTPRQTSSLSDIVITVTPHILHAPEIKKEDHLARLGGSQKDGLTPTIEAVVLAALEDEDQERQRRSQERQLETAPVRVVEASAPTAMRQSEVVKKLNNLNRPLTTPANNPAAGPASVKQASLEPTLEQTPEAATETPAIKLTLLPPATLPKAGEAFALPVMVNGDALLRGAVVALDFNPTLLQFKNARVGQLFGARATVQQQLHPGRVLLQLQPLSERVEAVVAQGELFVLEFTALASGPAGIDVNLNETSLRTEGESTLQLRAKAAQLTVIPQP